MQTRKAHKLMSKYTVDPKLIKSGKSVFAVIRGPKPKRVALHGDCEIELPAGAGGPAQKLRVPAPNAAELKTLFDQGVKYVIEAPEDEKPRKVKSDDE